MTLSIPCTIKERMSTRTFILALSTFAILAVFLYDEETDTASIRGRRRNLLGLDLTTFQDPKTITTINLHPPPQDESEEDYSAAAARAANEISTSQPLPHYTIEDALHESSIYEYNFCILVYDPPTDAFVAVYSKDQVYNIENRKRMWIALRSFTFILRSTFPERFTKDSPELVIPLTTGDYPHIIPSKLPHVSGVAPVLSFGSTFRLSNMYPNMIAMPMPEKHHLGCFVEWIENGNTDVCNSLKHGSSEEKGLEWDNLIPQVIWRGNDYGYLPTLDTELFPRFVRPDDKNFVLGSSKKNKRAYAIQALIEQIGTLLPRWKGVALTADAELKAEGTSNLPWANIKLSTWGGEPTIGHAKYAPWESVGIATGEYLNLQQLAHYKYQIDLGGCGATTWTGTVDKLALPGLLFHHVTPMKDYIHDLIQPWKHYIPVSEGLLDLKQKFDWAESHPAQAKRIADAGTEFMRQLSTPQGYGEMFHQSFVEPMRRVIEAYQPVASVHWSELLQSMDNQFAPVMICTGTDAGENSCRHVDGDEINVRGHPGGEKIQIHDSWWAEIGKEW